MIYDLILRWRWALVAAVLALTAALVPYAMKAAVPDNALTVWFLEDDPQLANYHEFQRQFGNDEVILLMVEDAEGIVRAEPLAKIHTLAERLATLKGVKRVHSLFSMKDAFEDPDGLKFAPAVPWPTPSDPAELAKLGRRALSSPILRDRLISADGKKAMLWIQMQVMADIDLHRDEIVGAVRRTTDEVLGASGHHMAGTGVIYSSLNVMTQHDFSTFMVLGYAIMFALLMWSMRNARIVLGALVVLMCGTIVSLGTYGLAGHQLNMVTVMLPTLIIVLGIANVVHLPSTYLQVRAEEPRAAPKAAARKALAIVLVPCVLTALTDLAGFLGLATAPMAVIRHLGIYATTGLAAALFAVIGVMTVVVVGVKEPPRERDHALIDGFLAFARRSIDRHRKLCIAIALVFSAIGLWPVVVDTYTIGYLPDDAPVVKDHEAITKAWGPYMPLDFMVRPNGGRKADSAELLAAEERFIAEASKLPGVRDGIGLHTVYRRMAQVFSPETPVDRPLTSEMVAQLKESFLSGLSWDKQSPEYEDNFLAQLITEDGSLGRLTIVGPMMSAKSLEALLVQFDQIAKRSFGDLATVEPAGYPPLYVKIIDYVMTSQIQGFGIAILIVGVLMLLWLKSVRLAIISLLPNVFPILVMRGAMGILGIRLDVATATVAAIVMGVAVDDTVHFLHLWCEAQAEGLSWSQSIDRLYGQSGRAAVVTTIMLVGGYPVLMLASVKTVVYFGLLTTVASLAALYGDLIILPLLLRYFTGQPPGADRVKERAESALETV